MSTKITIIGAGGHSKVVLDALLQSDTSYEIFVLDSDTKKIGLTILDIPIGKLADLSDLDTEVFVAKGNNECRERVSKELLQCGKQLATIIHKNAVVAPSTNIGEGTFVAALAVVSAGASLGTGVIVNHRAIVDHDCVIGNYTHIAPHATLGGGVRVGERVLVGANATLLPSTTIGTSSTVGAGSVVTTDVPDAITVVGNPAKIL